MKNDDSTVAWNRRIEKHTTAAKKMQTMKMQRGNTALAEYKRAKNENKFWQSNQTDSFAIECKASTTIPQFTSWKKKVKKYQLFYTIL